MEPDGSAQVAVFVDFENLVIGAVKELPDQVNSAPYEALTRLCRGYGNASVRRAYADWANPLFGGHQEDLAMNGVDLIQVARVGIQNKNAADIRMAVDAMETLIVHPEVSVFILVSGDGDYSPLVQRLREFGKWVLGVQVLGHAGGGGRAGCAAGGGLRHHRGRAVAGAGAGGIRSRDDDGGRAEEQDAGAGPGVRRAQLRSPELPRLPGHAAEAGGDLGSGRSGPDHQADRGNAEEHEDEEPEVLTRLRGAS